MVRHQHGGGGSPSLDMFKKHGDVAAGDMVEMDWV